LNIDLVAEAKALGCERVQGGRSRVADAVARKRAERWLADNREALESSNAFRRRARLAIGTLPELLMSRFRVYANPKVSGYLLDVQADLLSHLNTCIVVRYCPWTPRPNLRGCSTRSSRWQASST
jgi:post-segregation antitoxin (ccd killing protein)